MFLLSARSCALSTGCDVSSSSNAHSYSSSLLFSLPSSYSYTLVLWLFQQPISFFSRLVTFSFRLSEPLLSASMMLFFSLSLFLAAQWYFMPHHLKKQLKAEWRPGRAEAWSGANGMSFLWCIMAFRGMTQKTQIETKAVFPYVMSTQPSTLPATSPLRF